MKKTRVQQEVENYIIGLKGRELIKNELFWYSSGRMAGVAYKPIYLGFNYLKEIKGEQEI